MTPKWLNLQQRAVDGEKDPSMQDYIASRPSRECLTARGEWVFTLLRDAEWDEWQVLHPLRPQADYHADSREDALDTIHLWASAMKLGEGTYVIREKRK